MATTHTYTTTFTRTELIKTQVRVVLRKTTDISTSALSKIEKAIDNGWINKVTIYALDNQNYCHAQLILEIDWNEHNFQLSIGKATISIDEKWTDNTAIEVDEVIKLFNRFISEKGLSTEHQYSMTSNSKGKASELGWIDAKPIKWKKGQGLSYLIDELPELRVGFYLSE